ncbi:MAG: hypothetical protein M3237_10775 [Actinomycetota bacterium]|nr:hypothetical protein [Actinomycetota bacterium]
MTDHDYLDQLVRTSLERRAGEVDTTVPVAARVKEAASRRRTTRIALLAAAALVVAATVTGLLVRGGDEPLPADRGDDSLPAEWRTEYWRDMRVEVPADWGYGGAPVESGGLVSCYPGAAIGPDGAKLEGEPTRGYVGRPITLTDVCVPYPDNRPGGPQAPYVWLGAQIPTGTVDLGEGFVQETVEVNGSNLTVASDNAALRERIIGSAGGGEQCFSELEQPPTVPIDADFGGPTRGMTVCAYARDDAGVIGLTYSGVVSDAAAREFEEAFDRGAPIPVGRGCDTGSDDSWVVLNFRERRYVVSTQARGCPQVADLDAPDVLPRRLSRDMADPWAVGGIPAVVYASPGTDVNWMHDYFIGPQG